ncbi:MAG TPA: hypothetical protein DIT13_12175 [Verrucomicrobiales bacterium]|nr:hypothetical protein [Verrucomicrobiales bacterium]HRJ08076.1 hypothetical protein [Prosthecobacter sp.]HRK14721.1 hypothetical protein [Prosthecobacter sp.]
MKMLRLLLLSTLLPLCAARAQAAEALKQALTFHASFDTGFDADFSKGSKTCVTKRGKELVPVSAGDEVRIAPNAGRFGGALHFLKKGATRPQFAGAGILGYNNQSWSVSVSAWLRLTPDEDLEPGYCDPVQIIGDDTKKGFIFLEWSKDETPRFFRYAVRPLHEIWNPDNLQWDQIPAEKRPMVQLANAPFSRERWTHVVFTLDKANEKGAKPAGVLHMDGERKGAIEGWDLTLGWDPAQVALVCGAAYVGHLDDLAVFNRALGDDEVKALFNLDEGVRSLY